MAEFCTARINGMQMHIPLRIPEYFKIKTVIMHIRLRAIYVVDRAEIGLVSPFIIFSINVTFFTKVRLSPFLNTKLQPAIKPIKYIKTTAANI